MPIYRVTDVQRAVPEPKSTAWRITDNSVDVSMPSKAVTWEELPDSLPETHKRMLVDGFTNGLQSRSEARYSAIMALADAGVEPNNIAGFLYNSPLAANLNKNQSRITGEVSRVLSKKKNKDGTPPSLPTFANKGPKRETVTTPLISQDFWTARPLLDNIRQYAYSMMACPDAVLAQILSRFASMMDSEVKLQTGIGAATMNFLTIVLAHSGGGKGLSGKAAKHKLTPPARLCAAYQKTPYFDGIGIGTGEGLIQAYLGSVKETDDDGKPITLQNKQVRRNVYFDVDEGAQMAVIMERPGSILAPTLCTMWSGNAAGQANAREDTTRFLDEGTYALGASMCFQYETVAPLLDKIGIGLPQRVFWASCSDPNIPLDPPEAQSAPLPNVLYSPHGDITYADTVKREIRVKVHALSTGSNHRENIRSHEPLMRCKLSAMLALFEGRSHVDEEDWRLSGLLYDNSVNVYNSVIEFREGEASKRKEAYRQDQVEMAEMTAVAKRQSPDNSERVARNLYKYTAAGVTTKSHLKSRMANRDRHLYSLALQYAIQKGWVIEKEYDKLYEPGVAPETV